MASSTIDLSQLPAPTVVAALDFETIFSAMLNGDFTTTPPTPGLITLMPDFTALSEGDPAYKILQVCAYRELLLRQSVNDSAVQLFLAYATGSNLDQIGANYGVLRKTTTPANTTTFPVTPAVMESDSDFRARILLSLDGMSTAGPVGAYQFWALSAAGTIKDASVAGPQMLGPNGTVISTPISPVNAAQFPGADTIPPGNVIVTVMSNATVNPDNKLVDGTASAAEVTAVNNVFNGPNQTIRPLTDCVTVQSVTPTPYAVVAQIFVASGPDASTVLSAAQASLQALVNSRNYVGKPIYRNSIVGALMVPGVTNVTVTSPAADIPIDYAHTAFYTGNPSTDITIGGVET